MTQLVLASKWHTLENRRREALRAAHTQDEAALADLLESYILLKSGKKGRTSPKTLTTYKETLRKFLAYTGPGDSPRLSLLQLTAEDLELWMLELQGQGLKASSVQRHLYALRNLFRALLWAEVIRSDPSSTVRPPSEATPAHARKAAMSPELYRTLLALPLERHPEQPEKVARDTLLLLLGGSAGLRAAEIVGLELANVELRLKRLKVRGKGAKDRVVPLSKTLIGALERWLGARRALELRGKVPSQALLISFRPASYGQKLSTDGARAIVAPYYQALGLPAEMFGLHTLRRTAGTHLYRATRDLHVVADLLGHSSVTTSAIYAKMDMDVRLEALEKLEAVQKLE